MCSWLPAWWRCSRCPGDQARLAGTRVGTIHLAQGLGHEAHGFREGLCQFDVQRAGALSKAPDNTPAR